MAALIFNVLKTGIQKKHVFLFKLSAFLLSTYFLVYLIGLLKPIYSPRYLFFSLPFYYGLVVILIHILMEEIFTPIKSEIIKKYSVAVVVLLVAMFFSYFPLVVALGKSGRIPLKEVYPIREAYSKITIDDPSANKFIILDDAAENSFLYYNKDFSKNTLFLWGAHTAI